MACTQLIPAAFTAVGMIVLWWYPGKNDETMLRDLHEGITAHERGLDAVDPVTGENVPAPHVAAKEVRGLPMMQCTCPARRVCDPRCRVDAQLGGEEVVWKLDTFTHWELRQTAKRGSKRFLVKLTSFYLTVCGLVLFSCLAAAIADLQVRRAPPRAAPVRASLTTCALPVVCKRRHQQPAEASLLLRLCGTRRR